MKTAILIILMLINIYSFADPVSLPVLRKKFYASVDDAKTAKLFLSELENDKNTTEPLVQGYKAAVCMVMAKHVFNPYMKFKYFIDGKNELEQAINSHPENVELILIRFAIQSNVPSFLGYNSNIYSDKKFLILNLGKLSQSKVFDRELVEIMKQYLVKSEYCTGTEKESIKSM